MTFHTVQVEQYTNETHREKIESIETTGRQYTAHDMGRGVPLLPNAPLV